jgi:hypothetical protein
MQTVAIVGQGVSASQPIKKNAHAGNIIKNVDAEKKHSNISTSTTNPPPTV